MQMPIHTCSYKGGMNKDLSYNEYPNVCYFDAENLRVVVDNAEGMSSTSMTTPKGHSASFTLPTDMNMLGYVVLRDTLVILAHSSIVITNPDRIYRIELSRLTSNLPPTASITLTNTYYHTDTVNGNLVYMGDLGFDENYPIRVVGNYENANVKKIYWVDGLNTLKHLNIVYNATYNNLPTLDSQLLEIIPTHTYGTYFLSESLGGHLKAGRVQYSYQLYSISGSETMFAPPSNLYNLTNYSVSDGIEFVGNELETKVNKTIRVAITLPVGTSNIFNRIRLVAITYEEYNDTPTVRIVAEQELTSNSATFNDSGNSIGELVLEEFQTIKNDLIPTTIESKNNYLFAANLTEQFFDVDETIQELAIPGKTFLDTRAYRWQYSTTGVEIPTSSLMMDDLDPIISTGPGGHLYPAGIFGYDSVNLHTLEDSSWEVSFTIGVEDYAYNILGATAASFGGISEISWNTITLAIWDHIDWSQTLELIVDSFEYVSDGNNSTGRITIRGTSYGVGSLLPSEITSIDDQAVFDFACQFSYTMPLVGPSAMECTLNKMAGLVQTGVSPQIVVDPTDFTLVPETHDCINTYNNIENDEIIGHAYKFKYPLIGAAPTIADLGGTGPYISYGFISEEFAIAEAQSVTFGEPADEATLAMLYGKALSAGYKNPQTVMDFTSYQRGEVYRVGIALYDLKGRPSFTKWIGDIRFPNPSEELIVGNLWDNSYGICAENPVLPFLTMNGRALGLQVTIDWVAIDTDYPGLLEQLSGFQIVRVKRSDTDCTIKAQGLIVPTMRPNTAAGQILDANYSTYTVTSAFDYDADTFTEMSGVTGTNGSMTKDLVELISPEIAVNKSLSIDKANDFLEIYGRLDFVTNSGFEEITVGSDYYDIYATKAAYVAAYDATSTRIATNWRKSLDDAIVALPEPRTGIIRSLDGVPYVSRGFDGEADNGNPEMTYKGTTLVAKIESDFSSTNFNCTGETNLTIPNAGGDEAMYGRYRRYLGYSIYGGATYTERSYNEYIKVSEFNVVPTVLLSTSYDMYNGDVYICPFNFMKLFADTDPEYDMHSGQSMVSFPVESRINVAYFLNSTADMYNDSGESNGLFFVAEKQSTGIAGYPNGYPESGDLYRYNSAYSAEDISKRYPTKPFDFRSSVEKDVMITSSEPKINGEYSDSWLDFKFNNYIELEGEYGAITRIINHNDRLMSFQPRGVTILSVKERELIQTNNTAALAVGDGGVLSRYDYLSRTVGTSLYDAICPTELGMYFYSDKQNGIYRVLDQLEAISDTKGMKSYFETLPWTSCVTAYDKANREVLFTPATGSTLSFSGYIDAFEGFFTLLPTKYITFDKYILSSLNGNAFYLHNFGNYTEYYGVDQTSTLTLIVNPGRTNVASFHVVEWLTDLTDSEGREIQNHTFDELQITNTYQDTDVLDLSTYSDISRRFRKWRVNTFRDGDKGRIRDSWIKAVFTFYQTYYNRKLVVHPINFMYMPTKLW